MVVDEWLTERLRWKKISKETGDDVAENRQQAYKVLINSTFGVMGMAGFRLYDTRISESITLGGQDVSRYIGDAIERRLAV